MRLERLSVSAANFLHFEVKEIGFRKRGEEKRTGKTRVKSQCGRGWHVTLHRARFIAHDLLISTRLGRLIATDGDIRAAIADRRPSRVHLRGHRDKLVRRSAESAYEVTLFLDRSSRDALKSSQLLSKSSKSTEFEESLALS